MARFVNVETKVVVSVADDKADRFASGWTALGEGESEAPKRRTRKTSTDDE